MKRLLAAAALAALAAAGVLAGSATTGLAADPDPPNQGDPDKVLTVLSGYTCAGTAVPGEKKGDNAGLGPTITVSATAPIVKVTIKSGSQAEFVDDDWEEDFLSGTITISQDVSNYVVWTCSGGSTTTTETTPTTTETTPTTTETTPTTTETTPTTTETTPTTTETTPTTTETTGTTTETTPAATETAPAAPAAPLTPPQAPARPAPKPVGGVAGVRTQQAPKAPLLPPTAPPTRKATGAAAPAQPELAYTP